MSGSSGVAVGSRRGRAHERRPGAWERFWFTPQSVAPLVALRIVLGLLVTLWGLSVVPDATALLGPDGVLPDLPREGLAVGLLHLWRTDLAALVVCAALVPAGLALALGLAARVSALASWLLLLSIARRNPGMINSGDVLLRTAVLFLACSPAGRSWSLDRWLGVRRGRVPRERRWDFVEGSPWALRLLQLQLSLVYLWSGLEKVRGEAWMDGSAMSLVWRVPEATRLAVPLWAYDSLLVSNVATLGTIIIELALAALVWNRRARPVVLALGVVLHAAIEVTMAVGFFSSTIVACYLAFVEPARVERWLRRLVPASRPPGEPLPDAGTSGAAATA